APQAVEDVLGGRFGDEKRVEGCDYKGKARAVSTGIRKCGATAPFWSPRPIVSHIGAVTDPRGAGSPPAISYPPRVRDQVSTSPPTRRRFRSFPAPLPTRCHAGPRRLRPRSPPRRRRGPRNRAATPRPLPHPRRPPRRTTRTGPPPHQ